MAEKFKIEVTTPGKMVFRSEVEMATIPGADGEFGVLAGHSAVISNLQPGVVNIYANDNIESRIFVAGGFVEVNNHETTVLATEAYDLSKITKAEVQDKLIAAQAKFNVAETEFEKHRAQEALDINNQLLALIS